MSRINVLVTGAGGGGIGEQVVKSLLNGKNQYNIICTDAKALSVAAKTGNGFVQLPLANDANYLKELLKICILNHIQVLFPGSEPELLVISSNIKLFQDNNIYVPVNSNELITLCSHKLKFNEFLTENNFTTCETLLIDGDYEFNNLKNYPYVIKPFKGSGSANVFIVQNENELQAILNYLGSEMAFILQQYVGDLENEYTVGILSSPEIEYINHIILKRDLSLGLSIKQKVKNKTGNPLFGNFLGISTGISQGVFVENSLINEVVHKLVNVLKPKSTINMQCRIYDGKVYIFEVNPRFSGTSNLRALVGFNEPEYLINSHYQINNTPLKPSDWIGKTVLRGLKEFNIN